MKRIENFKIENKYPVLIGDYTLLDKGSSDLAHPYLIKTKEGVVITSPDYIYKVIKFNEQSRIATAVKITNPKTRRKLERLVENAEIEIEARITESTDPAYFNEEDYWEREFYRKYAEV